MFEDRSAVYRGTREDAERAYHAEARRLAADGFVPTSEEWSTALGQQVLTVSYAHIPDQASAVLSALAAVEAGPTLARSEAPAVLGSGPAPQQPPSWAQPIPTQAVTSTIQSTPKAQGRGVYVAVGAIVLFAIAAGVVFSQPRNGPSTGATEPTPGPTPRATPRATVFQPEPTPFVPDTGPFDVAIGEAVGITCNEVDCMDITVTKAEFAKLYKDPDGYYNDTPDTKGNVFAAVHFVYKATGPGADYSPFDWNLYANDTAVGYYTFVLHGPTPQLESGDLSPGKSAAGWIVWEVPATGRLTLEYRPGINDAIFEVTLRQ